MISKIKRGIEFKFKQKLKIYKKDELMSYLNFNQIKSLTKLMSLFFQIKI